jgi:hypothetical protein
MSASVVVANAAAAAKVTSVFFCVIANLRGERRPN